MEKRTTADVYIPEKISDPWLRKIHRIHDLPANSKNGFTRTDTSPPWSLFLFHPYFFLFSFVRSRLTWDPAARERGSRADIDSGRGSACCCREIDRWNSAERARRRWGLTTPIVAAERAWALARLITSERPFDDHDRPTRRTRESKSDRERDSGGGGNTREQVYVIDRTMSGEESIALGAPPEWRG